MSQSITAQRVISQYQLIPGGEAKEILNQVLQIGARRKNRSEVSLDSEQISYLRQVYEEQARALGRGPFRPRNLPFYHAIKARYPEFQWTLDMEHAEETGDKAGDKSRDATAVKLQLPKVGRILPSLISLLLDKVPHARDDAAVPYPALDVLPFQMAKELCQVFAQARCVEPAPGCLEALASLLLRAMNNETVYVICPVCPDYETEYSGDPQAPYRYTFRGVGTGTGVVADRVLKEIPNFDRFFRRYGLDVRFIVGQGDFEGFSESTRERLGTSLDEFLKRLELSQKSIRDACPVALRIAFLTDFCGGRPGWEVLHSSCRASLAAGEYGSSGLTAKQLEDIVKARKPLYDRWFGPRSDLEAYLEVLLDQAAEYAAMGELASSISANTMFLCADHSVMTPFYRVKSPLPVIYLKRNYQ